MSGCDFAARATRLLSALLLTAPLLARAQPPTVETSEIPRDAGCRETGSRARLPCEPAKTVVKLEGEMSFTIELPPRKLVQCTATLEIEYTQRNSLARVAGTLDHRDCAASSGEYTVQVRVRDRDGAVQTLEFPVVWQRNDARPVTSSTDYEIGADVDLLGVRTRQTRCTCADEPPPAAP